MRKQTTFNKSKNSIHDGFSTNVVHSLPKYCILLKRVCTKTSSPSFECALLEGMPTWTILYQSSVLQTVVNVSISTFFLLITDQYEDAISDNLLEVVRAGAIAISKVCLANRRVELGSGQLRAETIENVNEDHILYDLLAESSQFQDHIIQFQMALSRDILPTQSKLSEKYIQLEQALSPTSYGGDHRSSCVSC